jgi:uncharacterized protein YyaL (SSP411 family)
LTKDELAVAGVFYDIGEVGDMHHNPAKNVLHITMPLATAAKMAKVSEPEAAALLASAKQKLYAARLARPTPFIDKTVYTAWNGMCISAYLEASRVLGLPDAREFALKSLDRVLATAWDGVSMAHVVAYGEPGGAAARIAGTLEDYVFIALAALDAWEATGELRFYTAAEAIAASAVDRFYDEQGSGFFDTENPAPGEQRIGALSTRRKPLQDSPTPAGNPAAAALLLRLEALNGDPDYAVKAKQTLEAFAGIVEHFGLYAASYGLALQRLVHPPVQVCIISNGEGQDVAARELEATALARFAINKSVIRLRRNQIAALPPMLAETLPHLSELKQPASFAVVCAGNSCSPPVHEPDNLIALLSSAV